MALDDGDFDDPGEEELPETYRPWLPPEDRLWRHPSELSDLEGGSPGGSRTRRMLHQRPWPLVVGAGVVGALLATAAMAATGHLGSSKAVETTAFATTTSITAGGTAASYGGPSSGEPQAKNAPGIAGESPSVAQMAERVLPAMVTIEVTGPNVNRRGGGLIVQSNGTILTTYHLVEGSTSMTAVTSNGQEEMASVVGEDAVSDLAVLHVDMSNLPTVSFGQPSELAPGSVTIAVTVPPSTSSRPADVYLGTVERVDDQVPVSGGKPLLDAIETDAPVGGEVDGGALLDGQGLVVGITSGTLGSGSSVHCLATPADLDQRTAYQLIMTGHANHAWLGIDGDDASSNSPNMPPGVTSGVVVESVAPNSPAAAAGLQPGDIITSVDSHHVGSLLDLQGDIQLLQPGDTTEIGIYRNQSPGLVLATLGSQGS